jgi:hypothetical protein
MRGVTTASGPGTSGPGTPGPGASGPGVPVSAESGSGASGAARHGPEPGPPRKPPRSALTVRDLLGAVALLVVVVLVVGGLTRGCTFSPGGPTVDPSAGPTVDAPAQLRALARGTPFALRVPAVPADWRANAVGVVRVAPADNRAVRTGYITPAGRYLRVTQSDAGEVELVAAEADGRGASRQAGEERSEPGSPPAVGEGRGTPASGAVEVAGTTWVTYEGAREPIRVADVDGVRLAITGSGDDAEFRTLAEATTRGAVLPR